MKQVVREDTKFFQLDSSPLLVLILHGTPMSVSMTHRHPYPWPSSLSSCRPPSLICSMPRYESRRRHVCHPLCLVSLSAFVIIAVEKEAHGQGRHEGEGESEIVKGGSDFCPSLAALPEFCPTRERQRRGMCRMKVNPADFGRNCPSGIERKEIEAPIKSSGREGCWVKASRHRVAPLLSLLLRSETDD